MTETMIAGKPQDATPTADTGKWNFDHEKDDANETRRDAIIAEAECRMNETKAIIGAKANEAAVVAQGKVAEVKAIADGEARKAEIIAEGETNKSEAMHGAQACIAEAQAKIKIAEIDRENERDRQTTSIVKRVILLSLIFGSFYMVPDFWNSLPSAIAAIVAQLTK